MGFKATCKKRNKTKTNTLLSDGKSRLSQNVRVIVVQELVQLRHDAYKFFCIPIVRYVHYQYTCVLIWKGLTSWSRAKDPVTTFIGNTVNGEHAASHAEVVFNIEWQRALTRTIDKYPRILALVKKHA